MTWAVKMADARYDGYEEGFTEGREAGLQVGIQQGIEQGSEQAKIETAQNLLAMHLSLDNIAKATGLSLETLKNLQQGEIIPSK